jgi:diguanylate cyclase (GGDEF)-like protein/PAS domain S-box-containing protein
MQNAAVLLRRVHVDATELLQAIVDSPTRHAIIVTDLGGNIVLWNRGAARIFHFSDEEIIGTNARFLFAPEDIGRGVVDKEMQRALRNGCAGDFRWHMRKDGSLFWADGMLYPVRNRAGVQLGYVKILRDATEEKKLGEAASRLALEDSLTGLANRTEFQNRFIDMSASAQRHGQMLLLLLLDLDRFKPVNDRYGHAFGDALLQQAAHRMRGTLRDTDFIARLGGDEFAILLPDASSAEVGGMMAEKLVDVLSRPFQVDSHEIHVGASIGVSAYPQDATELKTLFSKADLALYRAKDEGRGAYRFYTEGMDASAHRRNLEYAQLRRAIKDRAFSLHYQPRIDAASGEPTAVEALLRCADPFFSDYAIADVIALAIETGRMRRLGLWAFSEAVRQVRLWQQEGRRDLKLSVNFGRVEFTEPRFADRLGGLLARVHLLPSHLEIEIPEAQLTDHFDPSQLIALHNNGVSIAVDDLGTGGLSLQHLFDLPISSVKLDLRFLPNLPEDPRSRAIASAIIDLGHTLGIRVIAERVESASQAEFFLEQCDGIQGYYVATPMTAEEMGPWLKRFPVMAGGPARGIAALH